MSPFQTLLRRDIALKKLREQIDTDITNLARLNDRRLTAVIELLDDCRASLCDAEALMIRARREEKDARHR